MQGWKSLEREQLYSNMRITCNEKHRWSSGYDACLPSRRSGFDSRTMHIRIPFFYFNFVRWNSDDYLRRCLSLASVYYYLNAYLPINLSVLLVQGPEQKSWLLPRTANSDAQQQQRCWTQRTPSTHRQCPLHIPLKMFGRKLNQRRHCMKSLRNDNRSSHWRCKAKKRPSLPASLADHLKLRPQRNAIRHGRRVWQNLADWWSFQELIWQRGI